MVKKYLNKVIDQIVSETKIVYGEEEIYTPFYYPNPISFSTFYLNNDDIFQSGTVSSTPFTRHCKEVYGLNKEETQYVWGYYLTIIRNKIDG